MDAVDDAVARTVHFVFTGEAQLRHSRKRPRKADLPDIVQQAEQFSGKAIALEEDADPLDDVVPVLKARRIDITWSMLSADISTDLFLAHQHLTKKTVALEKKQTTLCNVLKQGSDSSKRDEALREPASRSLRNRNPRSHL